MNRKCAILILIIISFFLEEGKAQQNKKPNIVIPGSKEVQTLVLKKNMIVLQQEIVAEVIDWRTFTWP